MKVFISGIGGQGASLLAQYYITLGNEVYGTDKTLNERIKALGIENNILTGDSALEFSQKIDVSKIDLYIYSSAFREDHPERTYFKDKNILIYEVGSLTDELIKQYLSGKMTSDEKSAFLNSNLLPLAKIDWNKKKYIAVTGTDGKTTTVSLIYHILKKLGKRTAAISTLGMLTNGKFADTGFHTTTPSSQELYQLLSRDELKDIDYVIVETTSHSLAMGRLAMAFFDIAVVTNITTEHLDYHKTWDNYFNSKARLITERLKDKGQVILNDMDKRSFVKLESLCKNNNIRYKTFSKQVYNNISLREEFDTDYNRINASLAIEAVNSVIEDGPVSIPLNSILSDFSGVKGRMEFLQKKPFSIIVDFAHTENALNELLSSLTEKLRENCNIRAVFGCAGMRDKSKRENMGKIAFKFSKYIYLCPEDPRVEDLSLINVEILKGMGIEIQEIDKFKQINYCEFLKEDRRIKIFQEFSVNSRYKAIETAIFEAKEGDIVVICGKGHEETMCFNTTEYEWSDQTAVISILEKLKLAK
ncbi:MAG TPA: UDP-N-acetylmuramyl-tripeptide synthetase [Spirochaetota bacterium]|jgi:UDP-N-acetylmuramoyl-L-alanyl-D-glutamate--2,6-diaminopimelate ligase|nr:MAG: UDP-N-acetylmuramoyl-L-alanyl-D-glutamate--LD-lysine ligase [Spirochaetes bacterium ADurb.Bin133]HNZ25728.1 UDP-N-acetylmuramyl-tripeptide synthetase [Spirochaetota bacterium]HPY87205.1 UDP-N-acetylmuramyl-tripeptide synthetase [Spirochaetota bacterium]